MRQVFRFFLLAALSLLFWFQQNAVAQNVNNYFGPSEPVTGDPYLVRVQILVYDSPVQGGLQMENVVFYGEEIPLKPRDIHGFRGQGTYQVKPGVYKLNWTVQRNRIVWPRTIKHEETVTIDPRDQWIQITVEGENATIS